MSMNWAWKMAEEENERDDEGTRLREQIRECLARDLTKNGVLKDLQLKDPQLNTVLFNLVWSHMENEEPLLFKNYYKRMYYRAKQMREDLEAKGDKAVEVMKSYQEQVAKGGPEDKTQAVIEAEALLAAAAAYDASVEYDVVIMNMSMNWAWEMAEEELKRDDELREQIRECLARDLTKHGVPS